MGRQNEVPLSYFELDCHMDDKIRLIEADFGLKGFAVVVKLWQKIYGGEYGYYCEWDDDRLALFASELSSGVSSVSPNLIKEIVSAAIKRNIFSEKLFKEYGILTSSGVQKQYLKATAKRKVVNLKKEYLLVEVPQNRENVVINSIDGGRNAINSFRNQQIRLDKIKEDNKNTMCKADALALFERLWKLYPEKKGKGQVSDAKKLKLLKIGYDEMVRAIERYKTELEKDKDWRKPQNGSTFFNSGYIDYLDANYVPEENMPKKKKNLFNDFQQREYDFEALEKELLGN